MQKPPKIYEKDGQVLLTEPVIDYGKSENGGWTKEQLSALGVDWPPPKGWKQNLAGQTVPFENLEAFYAAKS